MLDYRSGHGKADRAGAGLGWLGVILILVQNGIASYKSILKVCASVRIAVENASRTLQLNTSQPSNV